MFAFMLPFTFTEKAQLKLPIALLSHVCPTLTIAMQMILTDFCAGPLAYTHIVLHRTLNPRVSVAGT